MFHLYPYTDFHDLNLDWFLGEFKTLKGQFKTVQDTVHEFTEFVIHYFDNLDIKAELTEVIQQMIASGEFQQIISQLLSDRISVKANTVDGDTDDEVLQRVFTAAEILQASGINAYITIDRDVTSQGAISLSNLYAENAKITVQGVNNCRWNLDGDFNLFGSQDNHYSYVFLNIIFKHIRGINNIVHNYNIANSTFENCTFEDFPVVLYSPLFTQVIKFINCKFYRGTGAQIIYGGSYYLQVRNCHFLRCENDYVIRQDNSLIVSASLWSNVDTIIEGNIVDHCYGFVYSNSERGLYIRDNGVEETEHMIMIDHKKYETTPRAWNVVIEHNQYAGSNDTLRPNTADALVTIKGFVGFVTIRGNLCTGCFPVDIPDTVEVLTTGERLYLHDNFFTAYVSDTLTGQPFKNRANVSDNVLCVAGNGIYGSYKYGYVVRDANNVGWVRNFGEYAVVSRTGSFAVAADEGHRDLSVALPLNQFYPISVNFGYPSGYENSMTAESFYSDGEGNLYVRAVKTDGVTAAQADKIIVTGFCVKPQYS